MPVYGSHMRTCRDPIHTAPAGALCETVAVMETRVDVWVLWLRALFVGSFAFFLGVVGHVMANGLLPGKPFLAALFVFSILVSVPLLSRPATPVRMVALLVGGQTFIHLCLTLTAGHVGDPRTPTAAHAPRPSGLTQLPVVDGRRVGSFQDAFTGTSSAPAQTPTLPIHHLISDMSAHAPMMVVHLIAAAAVGLWLAHGERCLWNLVALTGRIVLALFQPALPVTITLASRIYRVVDQVPAIPRRLWMTRHVTRRGPPLLAS